MKKMIFTLFALLACQLLIGQPISLTKNDYSLILPEGNVHFTVDTTKLLIKFQDGLSRPEIDNYFKSKLYCKKHDPDWDLAVLRVIIAQINMRTKNLSYAEILNTIKNDSLVEYVAPVLFKEVDYTWILYNIFFVKLKNESDLILLENLSESLGFDIQKEYEKNIFFCRVNKESKGNTFEISKYLQILNVFEFVEPDFIYFNKLETNDTYFSSQWALSNTGQFGGTSGSDMDVVNAWSISTGSSSIKVAIIDCFGSVAQFTHPDITFYATHDATGTGFVANGYPGEAHGISCAGIIRATANNSLGLAGVAYSCKVIAVKIGTVYNNYGNWYATGNSISDGITWAYQNADIISNSNTFGSSSLINNAIANAVSLGRDGLGTPFFSSTGNDNLSTLGYPASNTNTIAVGASSMCDERKSPSSCDGEPWGSNYGTGLDVTAPGVHIYTTDISGSPGYTTGDYNEFFNGTSAACPMAAGVMALILSVNPDLTEDEARNILELNCEKVGGYTYSTGVSGQPNGSWSSQMGYGRVNAYLALQDAQSTETWCDNDNCNDAVILYSSTECQNTLCSVDNATPDYFSVPSCDYYVPPENILGAGVFFKFTAISTSHTITVTPIGTLDAVVVLYSGSCYYLIEVGCMDTPGGNGAVTVLTVNNLTPGTQYTIRVYDYGAVNASDGGFNICVTHNNNTYTITTTSNPTNGGTTSGGGTYQSGQSCTVIENENNGFMFTNWTENGVIVSTSPSYTFVVIANRNLVANFVPINYTITTTSNPTNGGTTSGGGTYQSGQSCTVIENENSGFIFTNWTENGVIVSTSPSYTFVVIANRNLVANFVPINYTITTASNPTNGGTTSGGGTYQSGQSCTVIENENSGFIFTNWTENGVIVSTSPSYTFVVSANRNLVANFVPINYTITTASNPTNGGTTSGGGTYQSGQSCTVIENENSGFIFTNWTENGVIVSTSPSYTFVVIANRNLVANFVPINYTITTASNPTNGGTTSGGGTYQSGQSCTVFENENSGFIFTNWTENGVIVSTSPSYTFVVTANRNLVANFTQNQTYYTVTTQSNPTNGGTTSGGGTYQSGQSCTVIENENSGFIFTNWTENSVIVSTSPSYTFVVTANRTLVANFIQNQTYYTVTTQSNPTNGGMTSGGGTYQSGQSCTVIENENSGFIFTNWTENGSIVSTSSSYTFVVNSNRNLFANFSDNSQPGSGPTFVNLYNEIGNSQGGVFYDLIQSTIDSSYIVLGYYGISAEPSIGIIQYCKIDKNGSVVWVKSLEAANTSNWLKIIKSHFGYILSYYNNNQLIIMEIDENGQKLFSKSLSLWFDRFCATSSGYIGVCNYGNGFGIIKLDFSGNSVWQKQFLYSQYAYTQVFAWDIVNDNSDNTYIYGGILDGNAGNNSIDGLILKLDQNGNLQWSKRYSKNTDYADEITSLIIKDNSDLIIGVRTNDNLGYYSNGYIVKLNSSGEVVDGKQIPVSYEPVVFGNQEEDESYAYLRDGMYNNIVTLNSDLNVIEQKTFSTMEAYSIKRTLDNRFVLFGNFSLLLGNEYLNKYCIFKVGFDESSCVDADFLNVDLNSSSFSSYSLTVSASSSSGCLITDYLININNTVFADSSLCPENSTVNIDDGINHGSEENGIFNIYPNPTKDRFTLQANDLKSGPFSIILLNSIGQIIRKQEDIKPFNHQITMEFYVSDLPVGIYYLSIKSPYNRVLKIVKQ